MCQHAEEHSCPKSIHNISGSMFRLHEDETRCHFVFPMPFQTKQLCSVEGLSEAAQTHGGGFSGENQFKNLGKLHKEWTEAGVKASRAPHTDVSRNLATVVIRGVLPGLRRRRTGLLPSGPKSSFQMRASFVFYLETKVLESGGKVEKLIAQVA